MTQYMLHKDGSIYVRTEHLDKDPDLRVLRHGFDPRKDDPRDFLDNEAFHDSPNQAPAALVADTDSDKGDDEIDDALTPMGRRELFEFARLNGFQVQATVSTADLRANLRSQIALKPLG